MRPRIRAVASGTLALLTLFTSPPLPAQAPPQLRSRVELVVVPVSARGKNGRLVADLGQADFSITEAGKKQTITNFSIDPVPISAAILIDTGISEAALNRVKGSFPALMGAFADDDEIALYRFDKYVEKLMDFSSDRARIERTFNALASATPAYSSTAGGPFSNTGPMINGVPVIPGVQSTGRSIALPTKVLHDAVFQAADDLSTRPIDRRKVLFVASDGRNQSSQNSFDAALDRLLVAEAQFFGFGVDVSVFQRVRSSLQSYAKATGGDTCFSESQSNLEACYPLSTEDARNQYVLGYVSTNRRPEVKPVFREIKVQVARSGLEIRHRKGYYQSP
ncbi:MAG TPA: VWA domain-containing protein [Terriglobia bacterium]|nr:VWA domain-containing protein [Terriglobia bacterium]